MLFQSTHPARGATGEFLPYPFDEMGFQSTHPARGATVTELADVRRWDISIHAPREGCDGWASVSTSSTPDFNPRTPRGVRPRSFHFTFARDSISIHAPREGCDWATVSRSGMASYFNPRTPRGVRRI